MSKFKGTEGEWILSYDNDHYSIDTERNNICAVVIMDEEFQEQMANAKLISAAPDLLNAIQYYFDVLKEVRGENFDKNPDHVLSKMLNAVNKATE